MKASNSKWFRYSFAILTECMMAKHLMHLLFNATSDWIMSKICDSVRNNFYVVNYVTYPWMTCGFMRPATLQFERKLMKCIRMGITIFKITFWEIYRQITVGNHVLRRLNFRPYIGQYTSLNENVEYSYPLIDHYLPTSIFQVKLMKASNSKWFRYSFAMVTECMMAKHSNQRAVL